MYKSIPVKFLFLLIIVSQASFVQAQSSRVTQPGIWKIDRANIRRIIFDSDGIPLAVGWTDINQRPYRIANLFKIINGVVEPIALPYPSNEPDAESPSALCISPSGKFILGNYLFNPHIVGNKIFYDDLMLVWNTQTFQYNKISRFHVPDRYDASFPAGITDSGIIIAGEGNDGFYGNSSIGTYQLPTNPSTTSVSVGGGVWRDNQLLIAGSQYQTLGYNFGIQTPYLWIATSVNQITHVALPATSNSSIWTISPNGIYMGGEMGDFPSVWDVSDLTKPTLLKLEKNDKQVGGIIWDVSDSGIAVGGLALDTGDTGLIWYPGMLYPQNFNTWFENMNNIKLPSTINQVWAVAERGDTVIFGADGEDGNAYLLMGINSRHNRHKNTNRILPVKR